MVVDDRRSRRGWTIEDSRQAVPSWHAGGFADPNPIFTGTHHAVIFKTRLALLSCWNRGAAPHWRIRDHSRLSGGHHRRVVAGEPVVLFSGAGASGDGHGHLPDRPDRVDVSGALAVDAR